MKPRCGVRFAHVAGCGVAGSHVAVSPDGDVGEEELSDLLSDNVPERAHRNAGTACTATRNVPQAHRNAAPSGMFHVEQSHHYFPIRPAAFSW